MTQFTKIALITLFATNFTLFLGWIPIGVLIPQALFFLFVLFNQPKAFNSKTLVLYYVFFTYQFFSSLIGGNTYDITIWGAKFLTIFIPLIISSILFTPKFINESHCISIYAIIVSFVTMLLSIHVLLNDINALRVCSMANSTGDWDILYGFWRQGMANYDMAAMMAFMPVVLVYWLKSKFKDKKKILLCAGIFITLIFMYLGQVTITLLLCLMVTLISLVNVKSRVGKFLGIGLILLLILSQFTGLMDYALSVTGDSSTNDRLSSLASAAAGETLDETSDAAIRWVLFGKTISSFLSNPLFGSSNAPTGGHNYFLDLLAHFGIIGCLPFFLLIKNQYRVISSYMSEESKSYYQIIIIGFILLGIMKNMSGTEYWNYLFIYYPAILVWIESRTKSLNTI